MKMGEQEKYLLLGKKADYENRLDTLADEIETQKTAITSALFLMEEFEKLDTKKLNVNVMTLIAKVNEYKDVKAKLADFKLTHEL